MTETYRHQLILASGSPRRKELLARLGVEFTIDTADIDESQRPGELPETLVQRLARQKAHAVAVHWPDRVVLGADTVVVLDGVVLGKPMDAAEATAMLCNLRGRAHRVLSAVYACDVSGGLEGGALNETLVTMRAYTDDEIAAYVVSGDPMDKAGAYAIQHREFAPVARIEGCYSGVMGFPLAEVTKVLRTVGVVEMGDIVAACRPFAGRCCQESPEWNRVRLTTD